MSEKRICEKCGFEMTQGYCIGNGAAYYCSDKCLAEDYTEAQYNALYEIDEAYWTEWEVENAEKLK